MKKIIVLIMCLCIKLCANVQSFEELKKRAQAGDADSQCNLGVCYAQGEGVEVNHLEALKWYLRSAEQGNAPAMCNVALSYEYGRGVEKNFSEAIKWYLKAVDLGNTKAALNLGVLFFNGRDVPRSILDGYGFLKIAAELGDSDAKGILISVIKDIPERDRKLMDMDLAPRIAELKKIVGIKDSDVKEPVLSSEDKIRTEFLNNLLMGKVSVSHFSSRIRRLEDRPQKNTIYSLSGMNVNRVATGVYFIRPIDESVEDKSVFILLGTKLNLKEKTRFNNGEYYAVYDGEVFVKDENGVERDCFKFLLLNNLPTINPMDLNCCNKEVVDYFIKKLSLKK